MRQYLHWNELEEYHAGMWSIVTGEQKRANVEAAANLMRDTELFEHYMTKAVQDWPNSCIHNLTADESLNKIAWIGHAGCCIGVGSPEENTRCAWHTLSPAEQDAANAAAARALRTWEAPEERQISLCL